MLRFVILKDGNAVVDVIQCDTTLEAAALVEERNRKGGIVASWVKAETLEDCFVDPYVHVWALKKQLAECLPSEEEKPKTWSNGRIKKSFVPKS
jgi:hypothetical protein